MKSWAKTIVTKYINVGTPTVLMGALWLYLWVFPWYAAYLYEPHWGHNYAEALAFLAVGLAYFNRRLVSDVLGFLASLLIILASLELVSHPATAITGGVLVALIIVDMIVERGRKTDLGQFSNRRLNFWLKRHVPSLSYFMLGHLSLVYFLVRLPTGTYETDLVTKVYDGMLIPLVLLAMLESPVRAFGKIPTAWLGFFWGMLTIIVSLILLISQPETWVCMAIALIATGLAIVALVLNREPAADAA
jgi:hypothetical protein